MPEYYPFNPDPRAPREAPPANTCDSQFHVFGDPDRYPPRPEAPFKMPSATIDAALKMHRALGIERGVIVQATTYGADHGVVLDALEQAGPNYRGCANAIALKERDDGAVVAISPVPTASDTHAAVCAAATNRGLIKGGRIARRRPCTPNEGRSPWRAPWGRGARAAGRRRTRRSWPFCWVCS